MIIKVFKIKKNFFNLKEFFYKVKKNTNFKFITRNRFRNRRSRELKETKKGINIIKEKNKNYFKVLALILSIMIMISIISLIATVSFLKSKLSKINYNFLYKPNLGINENKEKELPNLSEEEYKNIKNILLLGVDSRDINNKYNSSRSDSIMIFSINPNKHTVKLVSIPRDTYVTIPGYKASKINSAFSKGKEELVIKTVNQNFNTDISEYITIDFSGLVKVIDKLGGIDLEITEDEKNFINKYVDYTAKVSGGEAEKLTEFGNVHLTGVQVLTHCRNRSVGNYDFKRTERQRVVLEKVIQDILKKDFKEINELIDLFLPCVTTNIDFSEYIKYIPGFLRYKDDYKNNIISLQIPALEYSDGKNIDGTYYFVGDMDKARKQMREILYEK